MAQELAFNFDEASGDVVDYSGNGRNWALNNNALRTTDGQGHLEGTTGSNGPGRALTKLGTGMIQVASPAVGQTATRSFAFWLKGQGNGVWWFRFYISADDTGAFGLYLLGGNLTLRLRKGGANTNTAVAWSDDGAWHHYAATYDGTNARLYIDGALAATSAAVTAPLDAANSIQVMESSLDQYMDDLRVYSNVLTLAEVQAIRASAPPDTSEANEGTLNLAIGGISMALVGQAEAKADLFVSLASPALDLDATAASTASLALAVSGVSLAVVGHAEVAGTLDLTPSAVRLTLTDAQPMASGWPPGVGPGNSSPSVLVGTPQRVPAFLVGPLMPG